MKLNNRGWGYKMMSFLILILFIFFCIAVYYIYIFYKNVGSNISTNYYIVGER